MELWLRHWKVFFGALVLVLGEVGYIAYSLRDTRDASRQRATLDSLREVDGGLRGFTSNCSMPLPKVGTEQDTDPGLSWQTQLLPWLDQQTLYSRIDFQKPWNSRENARPLSTEIAAFQSPHERYHASVAGFAITHQTANSRLFPPGKALSLNEIADGLSRTIWIGEIGAAYPPWARPGNVRDPARGLGGGADQFGRAGADVCCVFYLDGNGGALSSRIDPRTLKQLADPDDGVPPGSEF